jgi:hypothetical protein
MLKGQVTKINNIEKVIDDDIIIMIYMIFQWTSFIVIDNFFFYFVTDISWWFIEKKYFGFGYVEDLLFQLNLILYVNDRRRYR